MLRIVIALVTICCVACPAAADTTSGQELHILVYGASGRIGAPIVEEALFRGHRVTGVTRDAARLDRFADRIDVVVGDILNRERTADLVSRHDAIVVSIGGSPRDRDPSNHIVALAARSLVEVLGDLGDHGPRLVFVGNLFTLEFADGKTLLELGRVPESHENYAMFYGHQIALDTFRASEGVNWTVASPPNGLRLRGRTGQIRWGGDELLRDPDGTPSTISPEDFAYAIFQELENGDYIRRRFNVAR